MVHAKNVPDSIPSGWTEGKSADGSVRIGIPGGWRFGVDRMDSSPLGMANDAMSSQQDQSMQGSELGEQVQQMANGIKQQADEQEQKQLADLAAKGIVVNVISVGTRPIPGEARTRYYVKKSPQGHAVQLVDAAEKERGQFEHKPLLHNITLPIGPALKLSEKRTLTDGGEFYQISYLVVDGEDIYSIRFITEESPATIDAVADQVMQTFRVMPSKA
jgi:hypothetical protein